MQDSCGRSLLHAVPAGLVAWLIGSSALANDDHDAGLYFDGSLGAGLELFDYVVEDTLLVNGAPQVSRARKLGTSSSFSIGAMPVFPLSHRLALGVRTEFNVVSGLHAYVLHSEIDGGLIISESVVGLYRPPETPFELGLMLGVEVPLLATGSDDVAILGLIDETHCADFGPDAGLRIGVVSPSGLGVAFVASGAAIGICHAASFRLEGTYSSW